MTAIDGLMIFHQNCVREISNESSIGNRYFIVL